MITSFVFLFIYYNPRIQEILSMSYLLQAETVSSELKNASYALAGLGGARGIPIWAEPSNLIFDFFCQVSYIKYDYPQGLGFQSIRVRD